jgi:hypothetical protein
VRDMIEENQAYEQWLFIHTEDNRSPREMFYFGFWYGKEAGKLEASS